MVIPSSKLWRKKEIFKKSFQIKITIAWIEYGMGKHVLTPLFLWWFHLCLREIPARRRFQKEKNVEKYIDISITYFFTFGSNGSEMESQIFAYFTAECELCTLSLWPFWTCEYIKNHKWSSFTSHFFIVTNWTSSVCKSTNSQRGKKANFFPTFFVENTQQNTMNNWWFRFDGGAQFLFTQFTRISLEIMLKNYNFSEMI